MGREGDWKLKYNHVITTKAQYITARALLIESHEIVVHVGKLQF
jgi:hypothetical protein